MSFVRAFDETSSATKCISHGIMLHCRRWAVAASYSYSPGHFLSGPDTLSETDKIAANIDFPLASPAAAAASSAQVFHSIAQLPARANSKSCRASRCMLQMAFRARIGIGSRNHAHARAVIKLYSTCPVTILRRREISDAWW